MIAISIGAIHRYGITKQATHETRKRALLAFASPKHERIMSLLDKREYDHIEVIAPRGDSPREKVSLYASKLIENNYSNVIISKIDPLDIAALVSQCDDCYIHHYLISGANFEIGLTGNKLQAVSAAVLASARKLSQAWYVKPAKFDYKTFTKGHGELMRLRISIGPE